MLSKVKQVMGILIGRGDKDTVGGKAASVEWRGLHLVPFLMWAAQSPSFRLWYCADWPVHVKARIFQAQDRVPP